MTDFDELKNRLAHRKGVADPGALAATIGRKKLGKDRFDAKAKAGRKKRQQELVRQYLKK